MFGPQSSGEAGVGGALGDFIPTKRCCEHAVSLKKQRVTIYVEQCSILYWEGEAEAVSIPDKSVKLHVISGEILNMRSHTRAFNSFRERSFEIIENLLIFNGHLI